MSLEELKLELENSLKITKDNLRVDFNRYNHNLGTIKINQSIHPSFIEPVLERLYQEFQNYDGIYLMKEDGSESFAQISSKNGQTLIDISRNHMFNLTL